MSNKFKLNEKVHPVYTQSGRASGTIIAMTVTGDEYLKITGQGDMNAYSRWNELFGLRWLKEPVYNVIMDEPTRVCTIGSRTGCTFQTIEEFQASVKPRDFKIWRLKRKDKSRPLSLYNHEWVERGT